MADKFSIKPSEGDIQAAKIAFNSMCSRAGTIEELGQLMVDHMAMENAWIRHYTNMLHPRPQTNQEEHF